mmetsp:Transcript_42403/g.49454  ORF Transcript_42403/g.49454 Transcript_42403/m.49454 type:complete len:99 (-) Transcript_42403:59-355(-)
MLSITDAAFYMEAACDFGEDIEYAIRKLKFDNNYYPKVTGVTCPQLELIAQGIAASSLKHSLKEVWVKREKHGIGKKEADRILEKHGLTNVKAKEFKG